MWKMVFTWFLWFSHGFCGLHLVLLCGKLVSTWLCGFHLVLCCRKMVSTWFCVVHLVLWCGKWFLHGPVWFPLGFVVWKYGVCIALCGFQLGSICRGCFTMLVHDVDCGKEYRKSFIWIVGIKLASRTKNSLHYTRTSAREFRKCNSQ